MRQPVYVPGTNPATSYSPAIVAGDFVFVSGQLGPDPVIEVETPWNPGRLVGHSRELDIGTLH